MESVHENDGTGQEPRFRVALVGRDGVTVSAHEFDDADRAMQSLAELRHSDFGKVHGPGAYAAITDSQLLLDGAFTAEPHDTYLYQFRHPEGAERYEAAERAVRAEVQRAPLAAAEAQQAAEVGQENEVEQGPERELDEITSARLRRRRQVDREMARNEMGLGESGVPTEVAENARAIGEVPAAPPKGSEHQEHDARREDGSAVPESLRRRFLQVDNRFHFRDDAQTLAFEDRGKRLVTQHNDADVAHAMVQLAVAKGWKSIRVKGSPEFQREAWFEARLRGLEVRGFEPRDVDLARLAERLEETKRAGDRGANAVERGDERRREAALATRAEPNAASPARDRQAPPERTAVVDEHQGGLSDRQQAALAALQVYMRARGDSEKAINLATDLAAERFQTSRVYVGKILEHGAAPYEHKVDNEGSYFIKLQTEGGEKTVWGVDLPRAMEEGGATVGDEIAVAYQGRKPVTVKTKERNERGEIVGVKEITTNRNAWDLRRLDSLRDEVREKVGDASRKADVEPLVRVYDRHAMRSEFRPEIVRETTRTAERSRGGRS